MLTLFLLAGCFDRAETTVVADVRTGQTHVVQHMYNAWPNTVSCGEKDGELPTTQACADEIKGYFEGEVGRIQLAGGTIVRAGIVLADGKLDFLYDYNAPAGGKTLSDQGLSFYWAYTRSPADVKANRDGKKQLALLVTPQEQGTSTIEVDGKYSLLQGDIAAQTMRLYTFTGKAVTVHATWVNTPTPGQPEPGPWLRSREGLEAALTATGLVITP